VYSQEVEEYPGYSLKPEEFPGFRSLGYIYTWNITYDTCREVDIVDR